MTSHATENAASGGMFLFGIMIALLGAVLPPVSEPLGLGLTALGNLFVALNAAILAGSLVFHVHALVTRGGWTGSGEWIPVAYVNERAARVSLGVALAPTW